MTLLAFCLLLRVLVLGELSCLSLDLPSDCCAWGFMPACSRLG
jgi:hypothetical protein